MAEDAFTARTDYYLGYSMEIGDFRVAHVWFQCCENRYFEKCPSTTLDTRHYLASTPTVTLTPTHINIRKK